jgi:hypothetical protein
VRGTEFVKKNEKTVAHMASKEYMKRYRADNRAKLNKQRNARVRAQRALCKLHEEAFWERVEAQCTPDMKYPEREPIIRHTRQEFQKQYYFEYLVLLVQEQRKLGLDPT